MLIQQLALVSELPKSQVSFSELTRASAALQKQVLRDFAPIWGVLGTVDAFDSLDDVPVGYWPIIVRDDIGFAGAAGIHLDEDGQPFALVQHSNSWELTTSHEVLEMLGDPFGDRLIAGASIKPGQGRVEYLVEVCDPSEAAEFAYTVNGTLMSDFYTPSFFDPVPAAGVRYSFTSAITKPRQVRRGGYLSWRNPIDGHWWQQSWFQGKAPIFRDLGVLTGSSESLRELVDRATPRPWRLRGLPTNAKELRSARVATAGVRASGSSKANSWRRQIDAFKTQFSPK